MSYWRITRSFGKNMLWKICAYGQPDIFRGALKQTRRWKAPGFVMPFFFLLSVDTTPELLPLPEKELLSPDLQNSCSNEFFHLFVNIFSLRNSANSLGFHITQKKNSFDGLNFFIYQFIFREIYCRIIIWSGEQFFHFSICGFWYRGAWWTTWIKIVITNI